MFSFGPDDNMKSRVRHYLSLDDSRSDSGSLIRFWFAMIFDSNSSKKRWDGANQLFFDKLI